MFSPIQLTPNMDMATLVNAVNDSFRQVESENRTKIIKDDAGQNRILLGRDPNGKYVLAITIPGKDVLEEIVK
jgi:hypothetical protein